MTDASPSSTEAPVDLAALATDSQTAAANATPPAAATGEGAIAATNPAVTATITAGTAEGIVAAPAAAAQGFFASIEAKLATFEHDVVSGIKDDVARLKALLHL
jgi:hypothetical protein